MGKTNKQVFQEFARHIFLADYSTLDEDQKEFVRIHILAYSKYRDSIIEKAITKIDRRKIRGDQYYLIRSWYCQRIPISVVYTAMEHCINFQNQRRQPIYSLKYFKNQVAAEFQGYDQGNPYWRQFRYSQDTDDNYYDIWGYEYWKAWKNGLKSDKYFDLMHGPNPHFGELKK